eukprot:c8243_g1_i1 orf=210-431(+)
MKWWHQMVIQKARWRMQWGMRLRFSFNWMDALPTSFSKEALTAFVNSKPPPKFVDISMNCLAAGNHEPVSTNN